MAQSDLQANLREIATRMFSGHAAVIVGSGVSKYAIPITTAGRPFPSWPELADILHEHAHGRVPGIKDRYLDPLKLAEQVEARFGRPTLNEVLRQSIPDRQYRPSEIHKQLLELPWSDIFTTNYDTLLERASDSVVSRRYDVVIKSEDLVYSTKPRIVKLHGSFPAHTPFIITEEDYRTYPQRHAPFVNTVRQSLLESTICLIGFSGSDPNFLKWIGWIRDNLGDDSPKIYFIHTTDISDPDRILMERRGIVALNLSDQDRAGEELQWFIDQIQSKNDKNENLNWPMESSIQIGQDNDNISALLKIAKSWGIQRQSFPGWTVLPNDRRMELWSETSTHMGRFTSLHKLSYPHGLKCAFELVWRMEKCLCPLLDDQISDLEGLLLNSETTMEIEANENGLNEDQMRHHLMLALLRSYRERGETEKWGRLFNNLENSPLSSDHTAKLHYERSLFALFSQNAEQLRISLADWHVDQTESATPLWMAKKAGILAEAGDPDLARNLLQKALTIIRRNLNLSPAGDDYTLLSQESIIMLLLRYVQASIGLYRMPNEFQSRVHDLKAYKCDPTTELALLSKSLQGEVDQKVGKISEADFDIGSIHTQYKWKQWNEPVLEALHFLRFCEDVGMSFRMPRVTIEAETARNAVSRIAHDFPFWAIASLSRIGDPSAVGNYFNRSTLATIPATQVETLVQHYVNSLSQLLHTSDPRGQNYEHTLAKTVPEILSRLCCKCSPEARNQILHLLLAVYRSANRSVYKGVAKLVRRLLRAMSNAELNHSLKILLDFPILSDLDTLDAQEFVNPFSFILEKEQYRLSKGRVEIGEANVMNYLESAKSRNESERAWAITTLSSLYLADLLDKEISEKFATALWSQVNEYKLPRSTNLHTSVFLKLPHPKGIDVIKRFKEWVAQAKFPIVGESESYSLTHGEFKICNCLIASKGLVAWNQDEVEYIFGQLVSWWDSDKVHLRLSEEDDASPFPSRRQEFEKRFLTLRNVLVQVVLPRLRSSKKRVLRRLVSEYSERNLPVLFIKSGSLDLVPEWSEEILQEIKLQLDSPNADYRTDSLWALMLLCARLEPKEEISDLLECISSLAYLVRFGESDALGSAIAGLGILFRKHNWTVSSYIEQIVLERLDRLYTALDGITDEQEFLRQLDIRVSVVKLARVLYDWHTSENTAIPGVLDSWREACQSSEEFAEIRNAWED